MPILALLFRQLGHIGGQRADKSVAQQDAEKRSYQRSGNFLADFFGRPAERAHGHHHSQHGGNNAQSGQRVGHGAQGSHRLIQFVGMDVHVRFDHLIDIKRFDSSHDRHSHGVAHKIPRLVILQEAGIMREELAFLGRLNVVLHRAGTVVSNLAEQVVHHLQGVEITLLVEFRAADHQR